MLTAAAFLWLGVIWLRMALSAAPQEMREAAPLLTTLAFLAGHNPYALATLPGPASLYGPLYPLVAVPFAMLLGPGLAAMRIANGVAIIAASVILFRLCRRQGADRIAAALGTALALAGWLYWVGPTVRPDGLALALCLGGVALFTRKAPGWRGFLPALVLWLLAFAAKLYFVFPAFVAALWTFCTGRVRLGIAFAAAAAAGVTASIVLLALLFPGWPAVALGSSLGATVYDGGHLLRQAADWALFSLPLLAGLLVLAAGPWPRRRLNLSDRSFPAFAAWSGLVALVASLGGHTGAHMTYFFHLLSPFAIIALAGAAGTRPAVRRAISFAFPAAILLNAHWFPWRIGAFAEAEAGFAEAAMLIEAARAPLATTEFAPLLIEAGRPAPENGHAEYFAVALSHPPPALLAPLWPPATQLADQLRRLETPIKDGLASERFDLVLTNPFGFGLIPRPLLERHYRSDGSIAITMPWADQHWQAEIWRPRGK